MANRDDNKQPSDGNSSPSNIFIDSPIFNYHSVDFNEAAENEDTDDLLRVQLYEAIDGSDASSSICEEAGGLLQEKEIRRSIISVVDVETIMDGDFPDTGECFEKTAGDIERLILQIKSVVLFEGYDNDELMLVAQHMYTRKVHQDEVVIEYGSDGHAVFVVKSGQYKCTVPNADGKHCLVRNYNEEGYFGELALLNHTRRAATITATTDGELWVLNDLRHAWLRKNRAISNAERFHEVLRAIPLFRENLNSSLTNSLIDAIEVVNLANGDVICRQGDSGDAMYFILEGEVEAEINQKLVKRMSKNEFFGERALVLEEGRAATCIAVSDKLKLAKLPKESFVLMMPDSVVMKMRQHIATNYIMSSMAAQQNIEPVVRTGTCTFIGD